MPWVDPATRATGYKVTASNWNDYANNFNYLAEIGYAEITSGASSSATTVGTAVQVVTLGAITYEAVPTLIEFYTPRLTPAANTTYLILRDGTTVIGVMGDAAAAANPFPVYAAHRFTPTAASHSYNIAMWLGGAGTATVNAGSGGTAGDATARFPAWMRATRLPT